MRATCIRSVFKRSSYCTVLNLLHNSRALLFAIYCMYMFLLITTTNNYYFPIWHQSIVLSKVESTCLLRGGIWIVMYYFDKFQTLGPCCVLGRYFSGFSKRKPGFYSGKFCGVLWYIIWHWDRLFLIKFSFVLSALFKQFSFFLVI
jgi:hypothetical protein